MTEIKRNIFREGTRDEGWGKDWTKGFNPDDLLPGTVLLDPHEKVNNKLTTLDFAYAAFERKPLVLDHKNYTELTSELFGHPKLVASYAVDLFDARNEGTKFGSRHVMVVTPVLVDGERFKGNVDLMPYFIFEKELELAGLMLKLNKFGRYINPIMPEITQFAKRGAMETALYDGHLWQYLELHDKLYPPTSDDFNTREFELRKQAEAYVIAKYSSPLSAVSSGIRRLLQNKTSDPYIDLGDVQRRRLFTPDSLKHEVFQR